MRRFGTCSNARSLVTRTASALTVCAAIKNIQRDQTSTRVSQVGPDGGVTGRRGHVPGTGFDTLQKRLYRRA